MEVFDLKHIEELFISILEYLAKETNEDITKSYFYGPLVSTLRTREAMKKYFDKGMRDIAHVKHMIRGKIILDAGCGNGFTSVLLSLLGADKVIAVDNWSESIKMIKYIARFAQLKNIEAIHGDVARLNLKEKSLDGIFCIEALSHIMDYNRFLDMAINAVREKGFFMVQDGNNGRSPFTRYKNYYFWNVLENKPGPGVVCGHSKDISFLQMRKKIIEDK